MPDTMSIPGTYGRGTPCTVHVYRERNLSWYAVDGSLNINATRQHLAPGVDVEVLEDDEHITASAPVESPRELADEVDDWLHG